ncbi:unnamed protein product [Rotaria sp. Silwood2]|nr:unnamed protein product [Rotaria sp. Silwood2]
MGHTTNTITVNYDALEEQVDFWIQPYPPLNHEGREVDDHDHPFFEYGKLSAKNIADKMGFKLPNVYDCYGHTKRDRRGYKINSKSMAISGFSTVPRGQVVPFIYNFLEEKDLTVTYVCVANEVQLGTDIPRIHIQIIIEDVKTLNEPFLDKFLNCVCEYHVAKSDKPWNEYIKKSLTFTEHGSFKTTLSRGGQKKWPMATKQSKKIQTNAIEARIP